VELNKRIAVLVLFFEKAQQTIDCVKSFLPAGVRIYILNNGSSKRNSKIVQKFCATYEQVTVFRSDKNLGVSAGRNFLIKETREEILFFVDNDICVQTENWLEIAGKAFDENPDAEVFTPRVFNVWENNFSKYFFMNIVDNKMVFTFMDEAQCGSETRLNCFLGGASLVRRKLFERLGLYDEHMFVGFEDYEFAIRGIRKEPIVCVPLKGITLLHDHAIAKNNFFDKRAVSIRYKVSLHEDSIKRIRDRHGVECFNDNAWRKWVAGQQRMVSPANPLAAWLAGSVKKIKSRIGLH
jgi:GT2 family glycosyltransferase